MIISLSFLLGLAVGSFINVLILRTRKGERATGRSYCPHCKKQLVWYELVPLLSFIVQAGRCRKCKKRIAWQYPSVELATALLFAFATSYFFFAPPYLVWVWGVSALFVALFVYDLKYLELPDAWVLLLTLWVVAGTFLFDRDTIGVRLLAGAGLALFFLALYTLSKGRWIGGGDVKIALSLGVFAAWPGVAVLFGLSYIIGALVGGALMLTGKAHAHTAVPFGPFLIGSAYVGFFFGDAILSWYLSLIL